MPSLQALAAFNIEITMNRQKTKLTRHHNSHKPGRAVRPGILRNPSKGSGYLRAGAIETALDAIHVSA